MAEKKHEQPSLSSAWSEETLKDIAKKYSARTEFQKGNPAAYQAARKAKLLDSICAHMKRPKRKQAWPLEKLKKEAAKYSTFKEFRVNSLRAYRAASQRGVLSEITSMFPEAIEKYSKQELINIASQFTTRIEFIKNKSNVYEHCRHLGILEEACSHMDMSIEELISKTKTFSSSQELIKNKPELLKHLRKNFTWKDVLLTFFPEEVVRKAPIWNETSILKIAKQFQCPADFAYTNRSAYNAARRLGILDKAYSHMPMKKVDWDKESVAKEALKHKSRSEFYWKSRSAYYFAKKQGLLEDVCAHMQEQGNAKKWDEMTVMQKAKECSTRSEFTARYRRAYDVAQELGILEEIFAHMPNPSERIVWDEAMLIEEAKKYKTRGEFFQNSQSAYQKARSLNILDSVCAHMKKPSKT